MFWFDIVSIRVYETMRQKVESELQVVCSIGVRVMPLFGQFGRLQERVASRRSGNDSGEPRVVDNNRIAVPEIDGGQIGGEDVLSFDVVGAAPDLVKVRDT